MQSKKFVIIISSPPPLQFLYPPWLLIYILFEEKKKKCFYNTVILIAVQWIRTLKNKGIIITNKVIDDAYLSIGTASNEPDKSRYVVMKVIWTLQQLNLKVCQGNKS